MKTFNIQISEDQLELIKSSIFFTELTEMAKGNALKELQMIAGMIEDIIKEDDTESTHGFCY
jgi:hypothetical protein|tara:strand:+ start:9578 stop:9763 length:186 start_codon:yes stop_codon:yes gene_type:complete